MILCLLIAAVGVGAAAAWATDDTHLALGSAGLAGLCALVLGGVMLRDARSWRAGEASTAGEPGDVRGAELPAAEQHVPETLERTLVRVIEGRRRFHDR